MIKNKYLNNNKTVTVISLALLLFFLVVISPMQTFCASPEEIELQENLNSTIVEELNEIDFSGFNKILLDLEENQIKLFSLSNIKDKVYSIISGENAISYNSFFTSMFSTVIEYVVKYLPILSIIVAIGIISNLLNNVKSKFNEKSTSNLINTICFLAACILIMGIINNIATTTGSSIVNMVNQINVIFPILLTLMAGMGATASVGAFQPIVAIMSTYIADIFNFYIIPLFMLSFVFAIISNFSDNIKLDKFSSFISSLFKWSVGIIFTLFFAVFSIQGISAGSFDSISIRTTKYTIKSYIPIMGGYLSEGMDLILASSMLIKNSIGFVGILLMISTVLSPLLEIVILNLMLKLTSAILQPVGSKISNFLSSTSKAITILSTSLIAISFMYLISVGLVMTTSNLVM